MSKAMRIVSDVYRELGKAFINLGQAIIIAAIVSQLFTQQPIGGGVALLGLVIGIGFVAIGLLLIQKAYFVKKMED